MNYIRQFVTSKTQRKSLSDMKHLKTYAAYDKNKIYISACV